MAAYSAKNSRITVGGTSVFSPHWTCDIKADAIDVTTFQSGGYRQVIPGIIEADVSFDIIEDSTRALGAYTVVSDTITGPSTYTPNWLVGLMVGNFVALVLNEDTIASGQTITIPRCLIEDVSITAEPRGALKVSVKGKTDGSFTINSGF